MDDTTKRTGLRPREALAAAGPPGFGSSSSSSRFLRGHQKTNSKGVARFDTIVPGW